MGLYIVFLCAHVRISISTYILTSNVIYLGLHQVTSLGVVFLFMLVNWWVEKHQRFLFNVYKRFFLNFCHVFYVFNVFYFFLERFLHLRFRPVPFPGPDVVKGD